MTAIDDIRDIFSIFHDGTISTWTGNRDLLTLTVNCAYLAERIDQSFEKFYVSLFKIDTIKLVPWANPVSLQLAAKTEIADIFKAELEILSAEIDDGKVVVICNQHDTEFDYCGGSLSICCQDIKVYDQNNNLMSFDQLEEICKNYWDELGNM